MAVGVITALCPRHQFLGVARLDHYRLAVHAQIGANRIRGCPRRPHRDVRVPPAAGHLDSHAESPYDDRIITRSLGGVA